LSAECVSSGKHLDTDRSDYILDTRKYRDVYKQKQFHLIISSLLTKLMHINTVTFRNLL